MEDAHGSGEAIGWPRREFELAALSLEALEARARRARGGLGLPLREWTALAEAWRIVQALRAAHGNRSAAARALGIGRRTLYAKLERLGLETRRWTLFEQPPPRPEPAAAPRPSEPA